MAAWQPLVVDIFFSNIKIDSARRLPWRLYLDAFMVSDHPKRFLIFYWWGPVLLILQIFIGTFSGSYLKHLILFYWDWLGWKNCGIYGFCWAHSDVSGEERWDLVVGSNLGSKVAASMLQAWLQKVQPRWIQAWWCPRLWPYYPRLHQAFSMIGI